MSDIINGYRKKQLGEFVAELKISIDLAYIVKNEDIDNIMGFADLREVAGNGDYFNVDIIYYSAAIDYLKEYDPSLNKSIAIACEMCYEVENITSEVLASLLASSFARNEFEDLEDDFDEFFKELDAKVSYLEDLTDKEIELFGLENDLI